MSKRRLPREGFRCRDCGIVAADRYDGDAFSRGRCEACRIIAAAERRRKTGEKLLDAAKTTRVDVRDGREYVVTVLPSKRPRRHR